MPKSFRVLQASDLAVSDKAAGATFDEQPYREILTQALANGGKGAVISFDPNEETERQVRVRLQRVFKTLPDEVRKDAVRIGKVKLANAEPNTIGIVFKGAAKPRQKRGPRAIKTPNAQTKKAS